MSTYVSPVDPAPATKIRAQDVNNVDAAAETAFGLIPDETDIKTGKVSWGVDTGIVNAYVVTMTYAPTAYASGLTVRFIPLFTNTAASTINVNGLGVKSVRDPVGGALAAGLITIGVPCELCYSATTGYFHMIGALSPQGPAGPAGGISSLNVSGGSTGLSFSGGPITTAGTITAAGTIAPDHGGTGVANNAASTLTMSGAYAVTFTFTGISGLTFPTTGTVSTLNGSEILTNKTLTTPVIASIVNTGTLSLPTSTDTLVGKATTDTLTNKSLSDSTCLFVDNADATKKLAFELSGITTATTRTVTIPDASLTMVGTTTTQTLTNKTLGSGTSFSALTSLTVAGPIVSSGATNGIGYMAGAGGSVTQLTDKTQGVTLNKACGKIIMHAASMASGAKVVFQVTSSAVEITDVVIISIKNQVNASPSYRAWVDTMASGSFYICLENINAGSLTNAVEINFAVIKGAIT